jgi:hypothetical protein
MINTSMLSRKVAFIRLVLKRRSFYNREFINFTKLSGVNIPISLFL